MSHLLEPVAPSKIVNVASVPKRSPFRYPGGKTWLVPYIRVWLRTQLEPVRELVEPFAGGAIVGLTAAAEGLAKRVTLIELDPDVASVWRTIFGGRGDRLASRISDFELTPDSVKAVLTAHPQKIQDRAFATILRNRVQRGGILAPGAGLMKDGENGKGLASRWYPETLSRRIREVTAIRHMFRFVHGDGLAYVRKISNRTSTLYFVDPPYTLAGRRLYRHSEIDHEALFELMTTRAGDFLMTYDDSSEIRKLVVRFRFDCETVPMRNTHNAPMTELLIGRNLNWARFKQFPQLAFPELSPQTWTGPQAVRP